MCDTFVAMPSMTHDGSVIFGKNSDREPNEAQVLEYHPETEFSKGQSLKCTYLEIPQVSKTNAVLISRPFWMWGAEIGANDKGVVIGNEAVFTKMSTEKNGRLTGMDLLRLALERADTSQIALEIIIKLLADFGQGGPCGFEDKKLTYHNSFIIADSAEAWVLETSSHLWVAKKVQDYYAISNGLTIGEEYDLSHPDLINYAKKKGWCKKGQTFNFAECYSDWFYTTFSRC
ncbi:C69 family dipeptidase, partial [Candidatus Neomarinimicrobiota bacterium]